MSTELTNWDMLRSRQKLTKRTSSLSYVPLKNGLRKWRKIPVPRNMWKIFRQKSNKCNLCDYWIISNQEILWLDQKSLNWHSDKSCRRRTSSISAVKKKYRRETSCPLQIWIKFHRYWLGGQIYSSIFEDLRACENLPWRRLQEKYFAAGNIFERISKNVSYVFHWTY